MIRFIYACAAIVVLSFVAVPAYHGIAGEREAMQQIAFNETATEDDSLSFEEIYEIAREGQSEEDSLNAIAPAAGDDDFPADNVFSTGFSNKLYPGLEDKTLEIIEDGNIDIQ